MTLSALDVALGWRDPGAGLVHHSDMGSQYAASDYRKKLKARGITVSMSRKGDCRDNAPMESANGTLKIECVHDEHFETREQARQAIVEYIGYCNTERSSFLTGIHRTCGIRAALACRVKRREEGGVAAMSGTALPTDGRFRFVASGRTSRPWITLIALRGVH